MVLEIVTKVLVLVEEVLDSWVNATAVNNTVTNITLLGDGQTLVSNTEAMVRSAADLLAQLATFIAGNVTG